MTTVDNTRRTAVYTAQNGHGKLTVRQLRQLRRAEGRALGTASRALQALNRQRYSTIERIRVSLGGGS